ncbi:hypothetical protein [Enterovibrio norvegicus]|uniref:hypothetical protein n=1 Tax=Enterovibrio norvegicus TaxID=188144 RepID=UPI000C861955|nr:hypothetical protein [Enterovibrio norvegicus]PML77270.1 hypothetical protein BCT69_19685 [Enterovibrio norvegicus]
MKGIYILKHSFISLFLLAVLAGCGKHEADPPKEVSNLTPWWQPLEPDVVIGGYAFYAGKCAIVRVEDIDSTSPETTTFRVPSRPLASCENWKGEGEPLKHDGEFIILSVCHMSFGAGGCAVERYRSADFAHWEEHIGVTWINGEEYEAWRTLGSTSSKADSVKKVEK